MTIIQLPKFYGHHIAGEEPRERGVNFDYVLAGNGLFLRGQREGLSVCFPVEQFKVRGLPDLVPTFEMKHPRVPVELVHVMLALAEGYGRQGLETLFHFTLDDAGDWVINNPDQVRTPASCRPTEDGPGSTYERAFIEAHSHHTMEAYFSYIDDKDETGFRIYVVVGRIFKTPKIRVRVGVYSYFWEIPAEWVFELPEGLIDCAGEER